MLARDYKARVFVVFTCFVLLFAVIGVRLFLIQIRQKEFFKILAKQQYELEISLNPQRAVIYDCTQHVPLAFNHEVESAFVIPQQLIEPDKTLRFLKNYYPDVHQRIVHNPDKQFLWVDRKLSPEKYDFLEKQNLKDLNFIGEFQRFYPFKSTAQVVGFTDIDNIGTAGIELGFSRHLGGLPSRVKFEKDARSGLFYFEKRIQRKGEKGKPVVLTIDSSLQSLVYEELKHSVTDFEAKSGSAIIINPDTGEVLSMVNYPSFDPNQKSVPSLDVMKNNVVSECYELGSVMKAFCALAALEDGVVEYDEPIDCEGRYGYIDGVKVENPTLALLRKLEEQDNILPFCDVIRYSSNVGIAKVAKRLGPRLYMHLRRLGFGSKTHIQFPGERDGFVNPPERWSRPSLIVMSFGYELTATLMQLARAFCIVANGGYDVHPTLLPIQKSHKTSLIKRAKAMLHITETKQEKGKQLYKDGTIEQMKRMLARVVEKYPMHGFSVMGKTGTARCVENGHYSNKLHNYTFAGIVEKDGYRRVVVTFIKEPVKTGLWASEVALPLFRKIAERMVVHDMMHHGLVVG